MRKRLALIICLLMVSFLGFVGCNEDPYANMTLSFDGVNSQVVQHLLIQREVQSTGEISYTYPIVEFTVRVDNYGDADPQIRVSGWEGYLKEPKITYLGSGVSVVTSQVVNYDSTGKFTLNVITNEGNKSASLNYEIDLKLDSFAINDDKLQAVSNSYEICLDEIGGLISYYPENSTQKDISYSVVVPTTPFGDGYSIDGKWADEDVSYFMDQELLQYVQLGYKYAEVVVDKDTGKQTLKVYPYFVDAQGQYVLDVDDNKIPTMFPTIYEETTGEGTSVEIDMITIKAVSEALATPEFIDIEVVASAGESILEMNGQMIEGYIPINKDKNGEYNVVLVDPDFKGGVVSAGAMSYYTERDIVFYIEALVGEDNILHEYNVIANNVSANEGEAIDISMIGDANQFKIHALAEGSYSHEFTIIHSKYPGLFDEKIKVNFKVIKMPFNIDVNGFDIEIGGEETILSSVYNVYPRGSYGTKFKVNTCSDFTYFLYLQAEDPYYDALLNNLTIRRDGDGAKAVFASMAGGDGGMSTIGSTVEGVPYTVFSPTSSFYLSHNFEELPSEPLFVYIGISFAVSDKSYSEEVAANFLELTLIYPIALNIENGIESINVTQGEYHLNLSDVNLEYQEDSHGNILIPELGTKLWELPAGKTYENSIKSITYDDKLIKVYPYVNETAQRTTLYMKYLNNASVGKTQVIIETLNQLVRTVDVYTFVPTIYYHNGDLSLVTPVMPLSITLDEDSSGFLYYTSGASDDNATAGYQLKVGDEVLNYSPYSSANRLFMIANATQSLKVFDYKVRNKVVTPIDVTDKISVSFSYPNYVRYENGVIYSNSLITYNIESPIVMTIEYLAGYEYVREDDGALIYDTYKMTHSIAIYIYDELQGVEVLTAKAVDLYVEDSLGYYDKDLAVHTIVSTYIPNEVRLGAEWNNSELFGESGLRFQPVELRYDYDSLLNSNIIGDDGHEIKVKSLIYSGEERVIQYRDLFTDVSQVDYELTVKSVISNDLMAWFKDNGYSNNSAIQTILQEHIFSNHIEFVVNVYINQFKRLQNVNQIRFTSSYASKTAGLKLNVEDDGVYFEVRKNSSGDWELSTNQIVVDYTIETPGAVGSELILANSETVFYSAKVVANTTGTGGQIIITPKLNKGVGYLIITPRDNVINEASDGELSYYNDNGVLSFRIKVADGSRGYEFEIASAEDYERMYVTTNSGYYYHYVITRDINLKGYVVNNLNVYNGSDVNKNNSEFCISGKHSYFKNSVQITTFNSIYGLDINRTVGTVGDTSNPINIGLFGYLSECVTLDNVFIKNASIIITEEESNDKNFNVGILAGQIGGATINSCSVSGVIKIIRKTSISEINVGGMIGFSGQNSEITNLPGNYASGVVSTGNNVYVDIELVAGKVGVDAELYAEKTVAGGLVGSVDKTDIETVQIVSNITTTIRAIIGGAIGRCVGTTSSQFDKLDVSPSIVANLSTVATTSSVGLYVGGIIGCATMGYYLTNSVVNFVDIGSESDYTWQDRANVIVYAEKELVNVGGIVGANNVVTNTKSKIETTYVRSYYKRVIDENYKGNVYVIANTDSAVGGIIGTIDSIGMTINRAYFDGNISVFSAITNIGLLLGKVPTSGVGLTVRDSYAIGLVYDIELKDEDDNDVFDKDDNGDYLTTLVPVAYRSRLAVGGIGSDWQENVVSLVFNEYANLSMIPLQFNTFENVYVIANEQNALFGEGGQLYFVENLTSMLNGQSLGNFFLDKLKYSLTFGEDQNLENYAWFWHKEVNTAYIGSTPYGFPVLLNNTMVMYDLVPTKIDVIINERVGLYDVSITVSEITTQQVIMYINRDSNGKVDSSCYYEMALDSERSEFSISLKGGANVNTTYVNVNNLKVNDKIEFVESSDGTVIEIVGNRIYPVSTGLVSLTIRSYVSKSIKAVLSILIVEGITDYEFVYNDVDVLDPVQYTIQGDKIITDNIVYVDELSEFNLSTYNIINSNNYNANENIGFILEILDASGIDNNGVAVKNGIIKINGQEFTYNEELPEENIYVFNVRSFKVSGVYIGSVKFAITPYLNLNGINYKDTYTSIGEKVVPDIDPEHIQIELENAYILDGESISETSLQKTYEVNVRARAKGVEVDRKNVEIDATNVVNFNIILETANVQMVNVEGEDRIVILENLYLRINNRKYRTTIVLTDVMFEYNNENGQYTCTNFKADVRTDYEYTLININLHSLTIKKTNVDVLSRNNTYKLTFAATIQFDREFYRANANSYDLNTVAFEIAFVPSSNEGVVTTPQMNVTIVPNEIETIFTNFYSKGVDNQDGTEYEQEYPEYNESTFIVPGRDGLLKITLDEEFNNSSYVTLTFGKEYLGYVTLQQLSAIVGSMIYDNEVPSIEGYSHVSSLEYFETVSSFGIKLSKLSLNYMDNHYFNNTYFVKILVDKGADLSMIRMTISSYKTDRENNTTLQLSKPFELVVKELPLINVTVDGDNYAVMGKGVVKELDIFYKGLSNDITFIAPMEDGTSYNTDPNFDYMYIADEEGNRVYGKLSLEYLDNGGKYYLYQDVETKSGSSWVISFNAQETILGAIEESKSKVIIDTVDFEINSVDVCGIPTTKETNLANGQVAQFNMLHGQTTVFDTQLRIKDVVVGNKTKIKTYIDELYDKFGAVTIAEYGFAGTYLQELKDGQNIVYSEGNLNLQSRKVEGKDIIFEDMGVGPYKCITISRRERQEDSYYYMFYEISGTSIGDDTYVRLNVNYNFDENGKIRIGEDAMYVYQYVVDIQIIVSDNSTYDHPTPIETQDDLRRYCSVKNGNYILLNNITLINWQPQEALFDTLDGNGYVITVESFDLSAFWGENKADVGIFTTVSSDTMLKNMTIDISPLLKTETDMINDIAKMRASSQSTYVHSSNNIDLGYIKELNFGILAGVNNGAITNAKIIARSQGDNYLDKRIYLHVLTTLGYLNGNLVVSNIGGIVGHNSDKGAISNSFAGVSINGENGSDYYRLELIRNASLATLNNEDDELVYVNNYPFVLAGGNNIAGLAAINDGIISNSYTKGLGVYNSFPTVGESATAGLVVTNNNLITSSFVEGNEIDGFRAKDNEFRIESTGYIGGLVYENNARIENSYTNAYLQTLSSFLGGFVYINNEEAVIRNAYSTAVNRNSLATGQFTGVKQGVIQNFGVYENCYYLVEEVKYENINEHAQAIIQTNNKFDDTSSWSGFSFVSGVNVDGIWSISSNQTPKIDATLVDTVSFRKLTGVDYDEKTGAAVYNYVYNTYYLGTKENPLLIDKAENFDKYIIDSSFKKSGEDNKIFGLSSSEYAVRHVRIVNNLDFENITTAKEYDGTYLYKIIFAGVLDGNGMTLSNLNINTDSTGLDNFGLFAQIGHKEATFKSVVKNFTMNLRTFRSTGNANAGMIAGTIVNSSIVNVKLNGNSQTISALNTAGAVAGTIYSTNNVSVTLADIIVENVKVEASYGSLDGTINGRSETDNFYKNFTVETEGTQSSEKHSFVSLYKKYIVNGVEVYGTVLDDNIKKVSYAGAVAGVIVGNNSNVNVELGNDYTDYRSKAEQSTINNIVAKGDIVISTADNSGGLFGYVGENTAIRNSKLIVSDNQLIKGFNNVGGIVGENHGIIELCSVAYSDDEQAKYDAKIDSNEMDNGTFNLFDMTDGEPYYVVSVGGIAGSSENGVIIDSYTTINVVKQLSYIAGGIIGYAEGYNYLGYVYSTGSVLGLYITGGTIGLQVSDMASDSTDFANRVDMDVVVALTNWNASNDVLSVRDVITLRLYENYKYIYTNNSSYYNFYLKMPEVGNASIHHMNSDEEIENKYRNSHNNYYVGSVVGKTMFRSSGGGVANSTGGSGLSHVIFDDSLMSKLYAKSNSVYSTTFGLVSTTGDVESGSRVDDYFKTSFTVENSQENKINSLSYRVAYDVADDGNDLNEYTLIDGAADSGSSYIDRFTFAQVFTTQEYKQQLLGKSYKGTPDANGYIIACTATKNIFQNGYSSNRYGAGTGSFTGNNDLIWEMDGLLPKFANGLVSSNDEITNAEKLIAAFSNSSSGKTYVVKNDISIDVSNTTKDKFIEYYGGIKSMFVGMLGGVSGAQPTITINLTQPTGTADYNNLASIFNLWSGATFQNIKFVININKDILASSANRLEIAGENYGLLANTIDGVYITDCVFEINVDGSWLLDAVGAGADPSVHAYNGKNVGVLFGSVDNSEIERSTFVIKSNSVINLDNEKIENVGLFAGTINSSNISECIFEFSDFDININSCADTVNIGGIAGTVIGSKMSETTMNLLASYNNLITVLDGKSNNVKNIGGAFGSISKFNYSGHSVNSENNKVMSLHYKSSSGITVEQLNIANFTGISINSRIDNYLIENDDGNNRYTTLKALNNGKSILVNKLSLGSMVGYDKGSTQIGRVGVVGNYIDITSDINSYDASAGGIVGRTDGSNQLLTNVFYDGEMVITNMQEGKSEYQTVDNKQVIVVTYATTSVGGLVGLVYGSAELKNVMSSAQQSVVVSDSSKSYVTVAIGGLIGTAKANVKIENFASIGQFLNACENKDTFSDANGYVYVGGVIGNNAAIFTGKSGYSYIELPTNKTSAEVSAITNGVVSNLGSSVFYAQEFLGNVYNNDNKFNSYAMGDLYNAISSKSSLYVLKTVEDLDLYKVGSMQLFIPKTIGNVMSDSSTIILKFNPNIITSTNTSVSKRFNVISEDISGRNLGNIAEGYIVSGKTLDTGKVVVSFNNTGATTTYFVVTNNGILSNVNLNVGNAGASPNNIALVENNNGLITNCYVYGLSSCYYAFALNNNGRIYSSVSSINSVHSGQILYAFVVNNTANGIINDCVSSSYGYTASQSYITKVSMCNENYGVIQYSTYYIPESMEYDNIQFNYVYSDDKDKQGQISSCYTDELPKNLLSRKTKFYEENSHIQVVGITDVAGGIVIRVFLTVDGSSREDIGSVNNMQNKISDAVKNGKGYKLEYEYDFYVTETNAPTYDVVRICSSNTFISYIDSLLDGYIPAETIVMLTNDLNSSDGTNILTINASKLGRINVSKNAAIIGINTESADENIVLDFYSKKETISGVTSYTSQEMNHEFIYDNRGVLTGFDIRHIAISTITEASSLAFATIITNSGVINNVNLKDVIVSTMVRDYVAGFVASNSQSGQIANCIVSGLGLSSRRYVNFICSKNSGYISTTTVKCTSCSYSGDIYFGGVN